MELETSLIDLQTAIRDGYILSKGMSVRLPINVEASIYGFLAIDDDVFSYEIDMPPLGCANVLANRVVFAMGEKLYRFPIFSNLSKTSKEPYNLYLLYVPKFMFSPYHSHVQAYKYSMKNDKPSANVAKLEGIRIENGSAFYLPKEDDLMFRSSSMLTGIANDFAVVVRRITKDRGHVIYEIYDKHEVRIENKILENELPIHDD